MLHKFGFQQDALADAKVPEKGLDDIMPFEQEPSDFLAVLGEKDYAVSFVVQKPERSQLLHHPCGRRSLYVQELGKGVDPHIAFHQTVPVNHLKIVFHRGGEQFFVLLQELITADRMEFLGFLHKTTSRKPFDAVAFHRISRIIFAGVCKYLQEVYRTKNIGSRSLQYSNRYLQCQEVG